MLTRFRQWLTELLCSHKSNAIDHIGDYEVSRWKSIENTPLYICEKCNRVMWAADLFKVSREQADTIRLLYGN